VVVVAALFPDVAQLDLTGPAQVLARAPAVRFEVAAAALEPVATDCGFGILPTTTFEAAPQADVLLVPGGRGVDRAMQDPAVIEFARRQARGAAWVTSVCTGSLVLGAAGLLRGRRATCHWSSLALLDAFGATPVAERVVRDGKLLTGAGVTSGIDLALTLVAELFGADAAREAQWLLEYEPQPPFPAGLDAAPAAWVDQERSRVREARLPLVRRAARAAPPGRLF
jgi:cyclohexyl-isocyanide hydratase